MKIGIYNPRVGIAKAGGTETFLRELMGHLAPDHDITLYCGEGEVLDSISALEIEIRQIPFWSKESRANRVLTSKTPILPAEIESLTMYFRARRTGVFTEMEAKLDVLSTHYYLDNLLVSRSVSLPTVFRFPGIRQPSPRWSAMFKFAETDTYVVNSKATKTRLKEWYGRSVDRIVYAGVDTSRFSPDVSPAFESNKTAILYIGRLDEGKGIRDLLEAQARLNRTELFIVGEGTLRSELESLVETYSIDERVNFVGSVPHTAIPGYYRAADIFCLPSYHESLGLVNLEAMATETPVVSTRIDAIEEYIDDGVNGLLVEPGDIDDLTNQLKRLVGEQSVRDQLARAARETATDFSWAAQAQKMETYYEQTATR